MSSENQNNNKENEEIKPSNSNVNSEPRPSTSTSQEQIQAPIVRRPRGRPRGSLSRKSSAKNKYNADPIYKPTQPYFRTRAVESRYFLKGNRGQNDRQPWYVQQMELSKLSFKKRLLHRHVSFNNYFT